MIRLTRAIPERIRGGLRRCVILIDVYFTRNLYISWQEIPYVYDTLSDCELRAGTVLFAVAC